MSLKKPFSLVNLPALSTTFCDKLLVFKDIKGRKFGITCIFLCHFCHLSSSLSESMISASKWLKIFFFFFGALMCQILKYLSFLF